MSNKQRSFALYKEFLDRSSSFLSKSNRKTKQCTNVNCRNHEECNFYHDNSDKERKICMDFLFGFCSLNTETHNKDYKHYKLPSNFNNLNDNKFLDALSNFLETKYTPKIQKNIIRSTNRLPQDSTNQSGSIDIGQNIVNSEYDRNNILVINSYSHANNMRLNNYFCTKSEYNSSNFNGDFYQYLNSRDICLSDILSCEEFLNKIISETQIISNYTSYFKKESEIVSFNTYIEFDTWLKQSKVNIDNIESFNHDEIIFNLYCITEIYNMIINKPIKLDLLLIIYSNIYCCLLESIRTLTNKNYILNNNKQKINDIELLRSLRTNFNFINILSNTKFLHMSYNNLKIAFSNYIIETNSKFIDNTDNFSVYIKDTWSNLEHSKEFIEALNVKPADEIQNCIKYKEFLSMLNNTRTLDFNDHSIILNTNRLLWTMLDPIYNWDLGIKNKNDFKPREPDQQIISYFYAKHKNKDMSKFNTIEFKTKLFNEIVYRILCNPDYISLPRIANPVLPSEEKDCKIMKEVFDSYKTCINYKAGHIVSTIALNLINSKDFNSNVFDSLYVKDKLNNIVNTYVNSKDIKPHENQENQNKYLQNYAKAFLIKNKLCDPIVLSNYKNMFYTNKNTTCISRPSMYSNHSLLSMTTY